MIEPETVEYLETVAQRVKLHKKTRDATVNFLTRNKIKDRRIIENCIVIGQVWAADCFGQGITNSDILTYLGEDEIDVDPNDNHPMFLKETLKGKSLDKILQEVLTMQGSVFK